MFVCLSVCLFFMHMDTVRASAAELSRNPLLNQKKVEAYFFPKIKFSLPPPPPRHPLFPTNGIAAFRFRIAGKSPYVFEGAESEYAVQLGEILSVD